jgi:hypothetical protein
MAKKETKRMGRPLKKPTAGQTASLGLRVSAELKSMIDTAALENGRSQSQEAEIRLKRSFDTKKTLDDLQLLATLIASVQTVWGSEWMSDELTCRHVIGLTESFFRKFGPGGGSHPIPEGPLDEVNNRKHYDEFLEKILQAHEPPNLELKS